MNEALKLNKYTREIPHQSKAIYETFNTSDNSV